MLRRLLLSATPVVGSVMLSACGGGGSSSPPPPPPNAAPSAVLSFSKSTVREVGPFNLDAGGSTDPDGDPLRYSYRVVAGPSLDLSGFSGDIVSTSAPEVDADTTFTVEVTVTDGRGGSDTATASIEVLDNNLPVAVVTASADSAREGDTVTLDPSESTDADDDLLSFTYTVVSGPELAEPVPPSSVGPVDIVLPDVDADTDLVIEVLADDGRETTATEVTVTILDNAAPEAALVALDEDGAETDTIPEGVAFQLDASATTDAEDDPLIYTFLQIAGPDVEVPAATGPVVGITAPEVDADALLTFEVQVDDGRDVTTERVDITVENVVLSPDAGLNETLAAELDLGDLRLVEIVAGLGANNFYILTRDTDAGPLDLSRVRLSNDGSSFSEPELLIEDILDADPVRLQDTSVAAFLVVREDGVDIVAPTSPGQTQGREILEVSASLDVASACAATADFVDTSAGKALMVGRDGGFSLFTFETREGDSVIDADTLALEAELDVPGDYCVVTKGRFKSSTESEYIAFDTNTNGVLRVDVVDDGAGGLSLSEGARETIPNLPEGLTFVDGTAKTGSGNTMGVILSDKNREGVHVAVNIRGSTPTSTALDTNLSRWELGVPSELAFDFIEGVGSFIFATTPGISYLVAIEDPDFTNSVGSAVNEAYVDVGLGADLYLQTSVGTNGTTPQSLASSVVVGYPDKGLIRRYEVPRP